MRITICGALAGFFVPVLIMAITYLHDGGISSYLVVALWPSSIILMGTDGQELTPGGIIVFVISVLLNQALYAGIAAIAAYFYVRVLAS